MLSNNNKRKLKKYIIENSSNKNDDEFVKGTYLYDKYPKKLYKYRKLSDNAINNIENQTLWLSNAESLDDQFELALGFKLLKKFGVSTLDEDYYYSNMVEKLSTNKDIKLLIEQKGKIKIDDPIFDGIKSSIPSNDIEYIENVIKTLFKYIIGVRKSIGVCSLTEENKSQIMWQMYGDYYKGICIEYSLAPDDYSLKRNIIPVVYSEKRDSDPINMFINLFSILTVEKDNKKAEAYLNIWLIDLLSTKNNEWRIQNEWRLVGKSNTNIKGPQITAIYIGSKATNENVDRIKQIAKRKGIKLYMQSEDYETMRIVYNEIDL